MKIYLSHAGSYDYTNDLYEPIRHSDLFPEHEIFLPHERQNITTPTKDIIASFDLLVCEASYPSTGQGIEIGLAASASIPIVCFIKVGAKPSSALKFYAKELISYTDSSDMLRLLATRIEEQS